MPLSEGWLLSNLTVFLREAGPGAFTKDDLRATPLPLVDVGLLLLSA